MGISERAYVFFCFLLGGLPPAAAAAVMCRAGCPITCWAKRPFFRGSQKCQNVCTSTVARAMPQRMMPRGRNLCTGICADMSVDHPLQIGVYGPWVQRCSSMQRHCGIHGCICHNYINHNYTRHTYIGHKYIANDYMGHNHISISVWTIITWVITKWAMAVWDHDYVLEQNKGCVCTRARARVHARASMARLGAGFIPIGYNYIAHNYMGHNYIAPWSGVHYAAASQQSAARNWPCPIGSGPLRRPQRPHPRGRLLLRKCHMYKCACRNMCRRECRHVCGQTCV